jgi:hypothetical protein
MAALLEVFQVAAIKKPPWDGGSVWFFRSVQNDRVRAAAVGFG